MTEQALLEYPMAVVERMPDSPYKKALILAIQSRMEGVHSDRRTSDGRSPGPHRLSPA